MESLKVSEQSNVSFLVCFVSDHNFEIQFILVTVNLPQNHGDAIVLPSELPPFVSAIALRTLKNIKSTVDEWSIQLFSSTAKNIDIPSNWDELCDEILEWMDVDISQSVIDDNLLEKSKVPQQSFDCLNPFA